MKTATRLALALVSAGMIGWIVLAGFLSRHHEGAETLSIASPLPDRAVVISPGQTVGWQGSADTLRDCNVGSGPERSQRVTIGKGRFVSKTPPSRIYGDQLVWLDVICDGRWQTQYARKAIVQEKLLPRTEVARVHFQSKKMQGWLEKELKPKIDGVLNELKDRRLEDDPWFLTTFRPRLKSVKANNVSLLVKNGFWIVAGLYGKIRVQCGFVGKAICPFYVHLWGTARSRLTVSKNWRVKAKVEPIKLTKHIIRPPKSAALVSLFVGKEDLEDKLNEYRPKLKAEIEEFIQGKLDALIKQMTEDAGPMVVKWLEKENVVERLVNFAKGADFSFTSGNSGNGGDNLFFSISASSKWLRRQGPDLKFQKQSPKHPIGLMVSYALVNRALGAFLNRDLSDVVKQIKAGSRAFGIRDGIGKLDFDTISTLGGHGYEFDRFLSRIGVRFDNTLSFRLPVSLRPLGANAVRFSIADARMFRGTRTQKDISISVWGEGNVGFSRATTAADVDHLTRHLGFEPVAADGRSDSQSVLKRYRATFGLANRVLRGEDGWTQSGGLPVDLKKIKASLVDFLRGARLKVPSTVPLGEGSKLKFRLEEISNDQRQYAVVLHGRLLGRLP